MNGGRKAYGGHENFEILVFWNILENPQFASEIQADLAGLPK